MTDWSQDNILVTAATVKKGGGVHAVLSLLQDLIAFQDKVQATIDAQDLGDNKQKLEEFHQRLSEMYTSLLRMAEGGVKNLRTMESEEDLGKSPLMMNDNSIEKLP